MILYHGTNVEIEKISLDKCRPYKDFGKGFYLTEIGEQAEKMATRTVKLFGGKPIVNIYEATDALYDNDNLKILRFEKISNEWARFVMENRSKTEQLKNQNYDIVTGPVADDDIATSFRLFQDGDITDIELVRRLTFAKPNHQVVFLTSKSLSFLKKKGVYYVE